MTIIQDVSAEVRHLEFSRMKSFVLEELNIVWDKINVIEMRLRDLERGKDMANPLYNPQAPKAVPSNAPRNKPKGGK